MFIRLNIKPVPAWLAYFPTKDKPLKDQWTGLRRLAKSSKYSPVVCLRLEWIVFYHTAGKKNVSFTAIHFGISRKTLHKWLKRFIRSRQRLRSLEDESKAPHHKRLWQVTGEEEANIITIRKKYLKYGKHKLSSLYKQEYQQSISSWKIERVIRKWQLYPDKQVQAKRVAKKRSSAKRIRINQVKDDLRARDKFCLLWHVDAIVIWWYGARRIIFTGIEDLTRVGYARVYTTNSSVAARDFLFRLRYLAGKDYPIEVMHTDNGSEFDKYFSRACLALNIQQVYSRVRTPTDNPMLERFNWTVQDEWLSQSKVGLEDIGLANGDLTKWLEEYNSVRPHQSLDYQTPLAYAQQHYFKVLPMWSARTLNRLYHILMYNMLVIVWCEGHI